MHLASSLLSSTIKRLAPSVYGVSLKGVHVQTQFQIEHTSAAGGVPDTVIQVGEDASFVCMSQSSRHHVCGVADGVGGWAERGVDPSFFSKFLMESCYRVSARESVDLTKPVEILTRALSEVQSLHSKCYGSSTACVLSLDSHSGMLYSANIGDSGYVVFRKGEVVEESQPLTHYFNCPYQLSNPPPGFNKSQVDRPSAAVTSSVRVKDGDLIVLASDGLFNNMYPSELAEMLKDFEYSGQQAELDDMVKRIVQKTYLYSMDTKYMSPFAQLGSQVLSWEFEGGKLADITVLLLAVTNSPENPT